MISDGILPAQQLCKGAPWIIRGSDLERRDVRAQARVWRLRFPSSGDPHQGRIDSWAEKSASEGRHPQLVAHSARRRENTERLRVFLSGGVAVNAFGEVDAMTAGDLRATLEAAGTPIGPYHLLIAAQALRSHATLVTANVSEFARVPGLQWQDWTAKV